MTKFFTVVFGTGILGSVFALRTYIGIAMILMVTTCSFKSDIVNYVNESRQEAHAERLAHINYETEKMKVEAAERIKLAEEEKHKREQIEKGRKQREQEQLEKEKQSQKEIERVANLKRMAFDKMCTSYFEQYKKILACANDSSNPVLCAQGYTPAQWYYGASQTRTNASNDNCPVDKPFWKN